MPDVVAVAMDQIAADVREGLLAIAVGAGLKVMAAITAADVTALRGPRGDDRDLSRAREQREERQGRSDGPTLGRRRHARDRQTVPLRQRPSTPTRSPGSPGSRVRNAVGPLVHDENINAA
jgi:hypothetical protein